MAGDTGDLVTRAAWLVLRAQAGDRVALEQLLRLCQERLRPYVATMLGDHDRASDVMQELLLTVYRKLGGLKEPKAFWGWARRIASRIVMAEIAARRNAAVTEEPLVDDVTEMTDSAAASELRSWAPKALQLLPPASREVLLLHYYEDMTIQEISAVLDIPVGTVKSRLAYGLSTLRRQ